MKMVNFRRNAPKVFILVVIGWLATPSAMAEDIAAACIESSVVLPLIGGRGDAPIIPLRVAGHDVAMYFSPSFRTIFVYDTKDLEFPIGRQRPLIAQNGRRTFDWLSEMDDVQLGGMRLNDVPAELLQGLAPQSIGDRPIIGVFGGAILIHMDVLLDVPNARLALFIVRDDRHCENASQDLMGPDARSVPMRSRANIPVSIDGKTRIAGLDPDLPETVLPSSWTDLPELNPDAVQRGALVTTQYYGITVGHRITLKNFSVAGIQPIHPAVIVQSDIKYAVLGGNFFADHAVLYDFPHKRAIILPEPSMVTQPGHHLHFDINRGGEGRVEEGYGTFR